MNFEDFFSEDNKWKSTGIILTFIASIITLKIGNKTSKEVAKYIVLFSTASSILYAGFKTIEHEETKAHDLTSQNDNNIIQTPPVKSTIVSIEKNQTALKENDSIAKHKQEVIPELHTDSIKTTIAENPEPAHKNEIDIEHKPDNVPRQNYLSDKKNNGPPPRYTSQLCFITNSDHEWAIYMDDTLIGTYKLRDGIGMWNNRPVHSFVYEVPYGSHKFYARRDNMRQWEYPFFSTPNNYSIERVHLDRLRIQNTSSLTH